MRKRIIKNYIKLAMPPMMMAYVKSVLGIGSICESDIIFQTIKNNEALTKIMVDVGAHRGNTLEPFARKGWTVYAFEPDPQNRRDLNILCNRFPNVIIDGRAVSDISEKKKDFFRSDISSGISGLHAFHSTHEIAFQVDTISLEELCKNKNISRIDFLKIDTEGHDLYVLKGVPWESISPEIILCEFEDKKTVNLGYDFHCMADFLLEMGYYLLISEWYPIVRYGSQHRWRCFSPYPCELIHKDAWGNIIAVKRKEVYVSLLSMFTKYAKHSTSRHVNIRD